MPESTMPEPGGGSTTSKSALRRSSVSEPSPSRPPRQPEETSGSCVEGDRGGSADGCVGRVENEHATRDTVEDRLGAEEHEGESLTELRDMAARDPTTNGILDPRLHLSKAEQRDLVQPLLGEFVYHTH